MKNCLLEIANIIVSTKIGITDRERESDQSMLISIKIEFKYEPRICSTDNIDDGICYMFLINNIINFVQNSSFLTIEKLTKEIFLQISQMTEILEKKGFIDNIAISACKDRIKEAPKFTFVGNFYK